MSRLSCATPKYRFATSCEVTEKEKKNNLTLTSDPKTIHDSEKSGNLTYLDGDGQITSANALFVLRMSIGLEEETN